MKRYIFPNKQTLGQASGQKAGELIKSAISTKGQANIILATGASQFDTLATLTSYPDIDWSKVVMFHLDEYVGMDETHPASFQKYLKERFVAQVPTLKTAYFLEGDASDPQAECNRMSNIIRQHPIDVALVGIGENGHLAFNDPPADFDTKDPYILVELDEACRLQQLGEGWFPSLGAVPKQAISMSVYHIMQSEKIICSVPDLRKAQAVKMALEGEVTNMCASSMLQRHPDCEMYLDVDSASLLNTKKEA